MSATTSWVVGETFRRLANAAVARDSGWVFPANANYQCFRLAPEKTSQADASFVRRGRFANNSIPTTEAIHIPPDLVVKVVQPDETYSEVERNVDVFLEAGVEIVWVINPISRTFRSYQHGSHVVQFLRGNDEIDGATVVPGFHCSVADLLPRSPMSRGN